MTNGSVLLTNSTAQLDTFTITNATVTFTNWTTALNATSIAIWNNGKLQTTVCNTNAALSNTNRVCLLCSNLTVNAGGTINVSLQGFIGGYNSGAIKTGTGPGGGGSDASRGGGGGYGGAGGKANDNTAGGPAYGSASAPADPGSGGGGGTSLGQNGGGAVWIRANGDVLVNGSILADGGAGGDQGGSGSGGGIYISCRTIKARARSGHRAWAPTAIPAAAAADGSPSTTAHRIKPAFPPPRR